MIQHVRMPHQLGTRNDETIKLQPVDKLVYVYMRKHANKSGITFVSTSTLAKECGINRRTVTNAIERLLQAQELYLDITEPVKGRSKYYKFNMQSERFEMFSFECLKELQENYSVNEKCVIIGIHELEFKRETYGFINYSLQELAEKINMSVRTLQRTLKSLEEKGVMITKKIPGKQSLIRQVDYKKIFQDILYTKQKVQEHDLAIDDLKERMSNLEHKLLEKDELIKIQDKELRRYKQMASIEYHF